MEIIISPGNSKIGNIPNLSLIPGATCGDVPCVRECYARKAFRMYPAVRRAWGANTRAVRACDKRGEWSPFISQVNQYITRKSPRMFRIHVAGDFISRGHLMAWRSIALCNPSTRFLAFTKAWARPEISRIRTAQHGAPNFRVVLSAWPGLIPSPALQRDFPVAYVHTGDNGGDIPANSRECAGTCEGCGMCWGLEPGESVYFHKH